mgnify:CR=1 FL=1
MSVQSKNLMLGLGQLYFKRATDADGKYRLVGALKGKTEFNYKREIVKQKAGETTGDIRADVVHEEAMVKASICDFDIPQLIALFGMSISTTQLTETQSFRVQEEHIAGVSTTDTQTLSQTAKSITSVFVTSLDRATNYVRGTDYSMPSARGIKPLTAGFADSTVLAHYTTRKAAKRLNVGSAAVFQNFSVMFVHKLSGGKRVKLEFPIAISEGDISIPWGEKEYTVYDIQFSALADPTKPAGQRLFKLAREQ